MLTDFFLPQLHCRFKETKIRQTKADVICLISHSSLLPHDYCSVKIQMNRFVQKKKITDSVWFHVQKRTSGTLSASFSGFVWRLVV